jgi:hypothetical protein
MTMGMVGALLLGLAAGAGAAPARPDAKAAFERLKTLAGSWRGNVMTADGPTAEVAYAVTSGGHVVAERLFPGTDHEMVTMYHLEGDALVLTHYCTMGNQPRMRLVEASGDTLRFDFTGGAGIDPARDTHMHSGTIVFKGPDRIESQWAVYDKGKDAGAKRFFMTRVKGN